MAPPYSPQVDPRQMLAAAGGNPVVAQGMQAQPGGMPSPNPMSPPGVSPAEAGMWRNRALYDPSDPQTAMYNTLADMGLSMFNPIIAKSVLPAAQGLGSAFNIGEAMNPQMGAMGAGPDAFKNFLMSVLSGGGAGMPQMGGQGLYGVLSNAMQQLTSGRLQSALAAGSGSAPGQTSLNPYLGGLQSLRTDPNAIIDLLTSLAGPGLGGATSGLRNQASLGLMNAQRNINPTANTDFLQALFSPGG